MLKRGIEYSHDDDSALDLSWQFAYKRNCRNVESIF